MRINYETCLVGRRCVLVPYRKEHVCTYHRWMQDPHLLEATSSEPLSLSEEFEMQQTWRDDEAKCTFIVLDRDRCEGIPTEAAAAAPGFEGDSPRIGELGAVGTADRMPQAERVDDERSKTEESPQRFIDAIIHDDENFVTRNIGAMVGDVNLFLSTPHQEEAGEEQQGRERRKHAELDIMIADDRSRRKGLGSEASSIMMLYGFEAVGVDRFFVKVGEDNVASRSMFEKTLGFRECNYAECFREVELDFACIEANMTRLRDDLGSAVVSFRSSLPG